MVKSYLTRYNRDKGISKNGYQEVGTYEKNHDFNVGHLM